MPVIDAARLDAYRIQLGEALAQGNLEEAQRLAMELSSTRVASVLTQAPSQTVLSFLLGLDARRAGVIFGEMPGNVAADLASQLTDEQLKDLVSSMPLDASAQVYRLLPQAQQERLAALLRPEVLERISGLARYAPGTAGALMTTDFIAIDRPITVGEAISLIRSAPAMYEKTFYIYIVTLKGHLRGVVSLRDLIRYDPRQPVERAMTREVIAAHVSDPAEEAARHVFNRRFMMLPVLDDQEVLVGIITFDDAMRVRLEEVAGDFVRAGGGARDESFFTPPLGAVRKRLPWMIANVFLNLGAVTVIAAFEETIVQVAILAAFLPMITDMGGNVGIQALSVAIRSIALGEVRVRDFWLAMRKEIVIGLLNGLALGALFGVLALAIRGNIFLGLIAGAALGINVLVAGVVGGTIPFLIKRLGKDPAMMTGPILTTITDITGVTIYLGLSTLFLAHVL
jgi:magnesium transporter